MNKKILVLAICSGLLSACGGSDNKKSNSDVELTPDSINLSLLGRYESNVFAASAAEIVVFDAASKQGFVVNAQAGALDVLDMQDAANPTHKATIEVGDIAAGAVVNSVATHNGILALAIESSPKTDNGFVAFYKADDLSRIGYVEVGALPDMLTFTPDGKNVLVANEGEPSDDYQIDPVGSISIIDVSDLTTLAQSKVHTASFDSFNDKKAELIASGVRIYGPNASVAKNVEPEYIAVSDDSKKAWAILQENNAMAVIDIATATITDILPLGYKDHGLANNGLDASDSDNDAEGLIKIKEWPGLKGMYQPDAISAYSVNGKTYLVSANEGDARAWGEDNAAYFGSTVVDGRCDNDNTQGFVEEWRVKHLVHKSGFDRRCGDDLPAHLRDLAAGAHLNPEVFSYCGAVTADAKDCREDEALGRLNITWTQGYQTYADGTPKYYTNAGVAVAQGEHDTKIHYLMYDELYAYGARSFAIWDAQDMSLVHDSGDMIEQHLTSTDCKLGTQRDIPCADWFNSNHEEGNAPDNRSDNKGPEPEGLTLAKIGNKHFLFLGLERMGGVMSFDISNPQQPLLNDYFNSRNIWNEEDPSANLSLTGELGPEGLFFIPAKSSPNGQPLLMVGNEVSGTTAIFSINQN